MSELRLTVTEAGKESQRAAIGALCDWLQEQAGFRVDTNHTAALENDCKWYAWRQLPAGTRDCECNDKPPSLTVLPHLYTIRDQQYASVEVSVTGQCSEWFQIKAYSIGIDELPAALPRIEAALLQAWEALAKAGSAAQQPPAPAAPGVPADAGREEQR